jgi:alpha-methylacyl-CoA racemase
MSGLLSTFGPANSMPSWPHNLVADFAGGGLMCAFGVLAALMHRQSTGVGQVIDVSMTHGSFLAFRHHNCSSTLL